MKKLTSLVQQLGIGLTVEYILRRMLSILKVKLYHYSLLVQPVPSTRWVPSKTLRNKPFSIRIISEQEYDLQWFPRDPGLIKQRYQQNCICWVAFKNEEAVGCQWIMPGPYIEDEVRCIFTPDPAKEVAWDFDIYITPKYRMGRLFLHLWDETNAWLDVHSYKWTASRIDALNIQSINSHKRMNASIVGNAWFLCIGKWQLTYWPWSFHLSKSVLEIPNIKISPKVTK